MEAIGCGSPDHGADDAGDQQLQGQIVRHRSFPPRLQ
jgi:hypothetical protein